jgi:hypothetical protein
MPKTRVSVLSDAELRANLLTPDACGPAFKAQALGELRRRTLDALLTIIAEVAEEHEDCQCTGLESLAGRVRELRERLDG